MPITVKKVNASAVFPGKQDFHYSVRTQVDPREYPQVHDFYELILVMDGILEVIIGQESYMLTPGELLLLWPGNVHTKVEHNAATHINLAFPSHTIESLLVYLYPDVPAAKLRTGSRQPIKTTLSTAETDHIQKSLALINQLPPDAVREKGVRLRALLPELLLSCFSTQLQQRTAEKPPDWLTAVLESLADPQNLSLGMAFIEAQCGRTPEHICRSFRKYCGCTPTSYLNTCRLNYAVNLLTHTDMQIVDVVYECGFQSTNYFYHQFKERYGVSPLTYKKQHGGNFL